MELIVKLFIVFCSGWGFMDILNRISVIPEWSRWLILVLFSIALSQII